MIIPLQAIYNLRCDIRVAVREDLNVRAGLLCYVKGPIKQVSLSNIHLLPPLFYLRLDRL